MISRLVMLSSIIPWPNDLNDPHSPNSKSNENSYMTPPSHNTHPLHALKTVAQAHFPFPEIYALGLSYKLSTERRSQNILELPLLLGSQGSGELDVVGDDEVPSLVRLLAERHAQVGIAIRAAGLRGAGFVDVDLLAVDGGHCASPARESFLQLEVQLQADIVSVAGEDWMLLL